MPGDFGQAVEEANRRRVGEQIFADDARCLCCRERPRRHDDV